MFVKDTPVVMTWSIDQDSAFAAEADYDLLIQEPDGVSTYFEGSSLWATTFTAPVALTSDGSIVDTQTPDKAGVWTFIISNGTGASYNILSTTLMMVVDTDTTQAITIPA